MDKQKHPPAHHKLNCANYCMYQVDIAQLAARRSHNPKVAISILTIHIIATAMSVCVQLAVASTVVRAFNDNIICSMPMIQMRKTHPK